MLTISFSDQTKVSVEKARVLERPSCFRSLAQTHPDSVAYGATGGECRTALLEYFGSGRVDAEDIQERNDLHCDLKEWEIPVAAWPCDLRLLAQQQEKAEAEDLSVAYQMNWVPGAVADAKQLVRASKDPEMHLLVTPGTGKFDMDVGREHQHMFRDDFDRINKRALRAIESGLEECLHMNVWSNHRTGALTVSIPPSLKRKWREDDRMGPLRAAVRLANQPGLSVLERLRRLEEHCGLGDGACGD